MCSRESEFEFIGLDNDNLAGRAAVSSSKEPERLRQAAAAAAAVALVEFRKPECTA